MSTKRKLEIASALALVTTILLALLAGSNFQRQNERLAIAVDRYDRVEAMRLLKLGVSPNSAFQGQPALVLAVQEDQMHSVAQELIARGAYLEARGKEGETALHAAAVCGSMEDVQALLAAGAFPNPADRNGNTPLHIAHTHTEMLHLLIQHGADVNSRNKWGRTPLQEAKRHLTDPSYSDFTRYVKQTIALLERYGAR